MNEKIAHVRRWVTEYAIFRHLDSMRCLPDGWDSVGRGWGVDGVAGGITIMHVYCSVAAPAIQCVAVTSVRFVWTHGGAADCARFCDRTLS